ncbi:MAG: 2-C-methyl-D-erythritol 4-phosphate cytidylyltransferase [Acidobacteriota bacterium]
METIAVILPAAGAGLRLGAERPKQFLPLGGKLLLLYSLERFLQMEDVSSVAMALPALGFDAYRNEVSRLCDSPRLTLLPGGSTRQESVAQALEHVSREIRWVAIHDVARPFFSRRLFERVWEAARETGAAIPGIEVADTIKEVDSQGRVVSTIDRGRLRRVQTPQVFSQDLLRRCVALAQRDGWTVTDDAMLLERSGYCVQMVPGLEENIKITSAQDYQWAEQWIRTTSE